MNILYNILYNIFAVTGFLFWLLMLIIVLVALYCWIADIIFYYCSRTARYNIPEYEPMEHQPVDLSIHGSMSNPSAEVIAKSFSGGRYR